MMIYKIEINLNILVDENFFPYKMVFEKEE